MIREILLKITREYLIEKKKSVKNNLLHKYIREDAPQILNNIIGRGDLDDFHIKASGGEGRWRGVPWITILHKGVSLSRNLKKPEKHKPSAKWGFYPAYLFKGDMSEILFGLVQAETNVRQQYSSRNVDTILKSRAIILREKLPEYKEYFPDRINIKLYDNTFSPKMIKEAERWVISTAFGKIYKSKKLPDEEELQTDLLKMFALFNKAIERGGIEEKREYTETPKLEKNIEEITLIKKEKPEVNRSNTDSIKKEKESKSIKVDYLSRYKKNLELGEFGEELVFKYEKKFLEKKQHNFEKYPIVHTSKEDDSAGYDIKSYDGHGKEKYIEVKTTRGNDKMSFDITPNELEFGKKNKENFYIYRVYQPDKTSEKWEFYEIKGKDLDKVLIFEPSGYKAKLR